MMEFFGEFRLWAANRLIGDLVVWSDDANGRLLSLGPKRVGAALAREEN